MFDCLLWWIEHGGWRRACVWVCGLFLFMVVCMIVLSLLIVRCDGEIMIGDVDLVCECGCVFVSVVCDCVWLLVVWCD